MWLRKTVTHRKKSYHSRDKVYYITNSYKWSRGNIFGSFNHLLSLGLEFLRFMLISSEMCFWSVNYAYITGIWYVKGYFWCKLQLHGMTRSQYLPWGLGVLESWPPSLPLRATWHNRQVVEKVIIIWSLCNKN